MIINGGPGDETLTGTSGDDVIYGGGGTDTMIGLDGNDTYYLDDGDGEVIEAIGGGFDTIFTGTDYTVAADQEIEVLIFRRLRPGGIVVRANDFGMHLISESTLFLSLYGGAGDDVIEVVGGTTVYAGAGDDIIEASGDHNFLGGGAGDDVITSTGFHSQIDGGTGADIMSTGAGQGRLNTFDVDNAGDQIVGSEVDATVRVSVDWTLKGGLISGTLLAVGSAGLHLTSEVANVKLVGAAGDDTLTGGNVLDGGAGADTLVGGAADNTYYVDNAGDQVIEVAGGGSDTIYTSMSLTLNGAQEIETLRVYGSAGLTLTGDFRDNDLIGGAGADTLNGGGGNDSLDGGLGADGMAGGAGNDIYYVDTAGDQVTEAAGGGSDTVYTTVSFTLGADLEVEYLRGVYGSAGLTLTGNELANTLIGERRNDTLNGGGGNDTLDGGLGADVMAGGAGNDTYFVERLGDQVIEAAGGGNDTVYASSTFRLGAGQEVEFLRVYGSVALTLTGNELANSLIGDAGADTLSGGGGNDTLDGRTGADVMAGGAGNDIYYVDTAGDQVTEAAAGGSDTVYARARYTLAAGQEIEVLRVLGSAGLTLAGNERDNALYGSTGSDTLNGGGGRDTLNGRAGADTMAGGTGNDTYYVDNAGDRVIEVAGGGNDTVYASSTFRLGSGHEVEFLRVYGSAALTLTGNELANYLIGNAGNDTLNGGDGDDTLEGRAGADTMAGGRGNDIYYVANSADQVIEVVGWGSDNVYASASFTLGAGQEVEYLRVYGSAGLTLTGNELANYLIGRTGSDTLNGGGGNDTLDGAGGADTLAGGAGNDTYYVDNAGDRVIEAAGGGSDTIYTGLNLTLTGAQEIETLRVYGSAGLTLTGNELANSLIGGAGADTLSGGGGNDTLDGRIGADVMAGGAGNDIYYVDTAGDQVTEAAAGGSDTVYARARYTLAAGQEIEVLRVLGSAGLTLAGNERDNALYGSTGSDTLNGGGGRDTLNGRAGADTMAGGAGNDTYYVDNAGDRVIEAAGGGNDLVYTSASFTLEAGQYVQSLTGTGSAGLTLTGNALANTITGSSGNDTLNGGAGNDSLYGGAGGDFFLFDTQFIGVTNVDTLADFDWISDTIQLDHNVFGGLRIGPLSASAFAVDQATGSTPQIVYESATGSMYYDSNGAGAGGATTFATVAPNLQSLNEAVFIIV